MRRPTRLRDALALGVTTATTTGTAVLALACPSATAASASVGPAAFGPGPSPQPSSRPGSERAAKPPTCGKASDPDFPIDTRIHGGPTAYVPGGGPRSFAVDLTNTTAEPCRDIHPVLALADQDRILQPAQIRLDFYDAEARRWRPVPFEETEEDENVGVFTGFPGFEVPAGATLTVPLRLAFRADTAPNEVVAGAAIVQRRGDDGDWVGESGDYRLTIGPDSPDSPDSRDSPDSPEALEEPPDRDAEKDVGKEAAPDPEETAEGATPLPEATAPLPEATAPLPEATAPPRGDSGLPPTWQRPELAQTGDESSPTTLAPVAGALLLAGAALLVATARRLTYRHKDGSPRS
ncbi:hypothetical protein GPZ77_12630 [Streptomyces sp. QHH-9511]|uniref:hypothetical protein n=1 Tax=Streptomyces sp. QHH-9511 TaxID=2684468 RepID=UPI0013184B6D|nr:hypothetical protein [Streptomyces sp. QHH-9511]QGZ49116.1 hypothetical protein GPZ77_12630 [Streptomyces sp. QHH-9511]